MFRPNGIQSVISQGKYYNLSSLLSEILKEPDNREKVVRCVRRPISVLTLVDKVKEFLVVSLCIINSSQGTKHFFFLLNTTAY